MNTASVKTKLLETRAEIVKRIDAIRRDLAKEHSHDFSEQVTERENDEVLEGLLAEAEQERQAINTALVRIDDGAYGTCIQCGRSIAERRLMARPEASTCIDCAT